MNIKALLFAAASLISLTAFADGVEGVTRITGADCSLYGKNPVTKFDSIMTRVNGNTAKVWVYSGARNPINPNQGLVASGTGPAYSMVGFPNNNAETVIIKLDENVQKITGLPRLVISSKIKNPSTDMPSNGFLSNPMTEDEDVNLRCYMDFNETSEDLFQINTEHVQKAQQPSVCSIEFRDGTRVPNFIHGCTATVVGENKLLTASHCHEFYNKLETRVRCGSDPTWRQIERWKANPDYRPQDHAVSNPHDISVITLDSKLSSPSVAMEQDSKAIEKMIMENKNCRHYGMGTRIDGSIGALYTSRYHEPDPILGGYDYVTRIFEMTHMIANDPNRFVRSGDSGGPLICENDRGQDVIVGVHSFLSLPSSSSMSAMTSRSWGFIQAELQK